MGKVSHDSHILTISEIYINFIADFVEYILRMYYVIYRELMKCSAWRDFMANSRDREKFVELAEKRVSRALKDIKLIGNLSNRTNYSYTEQDVKKITAALKKSVDEMKARFDAKGDSVDEAFRL